MKTKVIKSIFFFVIVFGILVSLSCSRSIDTPRELSVMRKALNDYGDKVMHYKSKRGHFPSSMDEVIDNEAELAEFKAKFRYHCNSEIDMALIAFKKPVEGSETMIILILDEPKLIYVHNVMELEKEIKERLRR